MELSTLAAFAVTAGAVVVSPGPDTALILRHALTGGRRTGMAAVLGVQLGLLVHFTLAALGVSLIIASSPVLYRSVAFMGAAYLAWIGIQGLLGGGPLRLKADGPAASGRRAMRDAMVTNLLNPKVIILFLGLLPNFVDRTADTVTQQMMVLTATLIIINTLWQAPMAWAADAVRRWLANDRAQRWIAIGTGVVLIGFAVLMVADNLTGGGPQ